MIFIFILEHAVCSYKYVFIPCVISLLTVCSWWLSFWIIRNTEETAQWFKTSLLLETWGII